MDRMDLEDRIAPFKLVSHDSGHSLLLDVGEYKTELFDLRAEEGFEGNGYDWGSLAQVFLDEQMPELTEEIGFDPEGSMFCAYAKDLEALRQFALGFHEACEDEEMIQDLFSRAELD